MSPPTKRKPGEPRKVKGEGDQGIVTVTLNDDMITVAWFCGETRTFTVEELRRQIAWLDNHGSQFDMWFNNKDSNHVGFWVSLHDGKLIANDSITTSDTPSVPWANLKRALQATIKEALD